MVFKRLFALLLLIAGVFGMLSFHQQDAGDSWIRINLLGYKPSGVKVAVWCSKQNESISSFQLVDAVTHKVVFEGSAGQPFGAYGPFMETYRLRFSSFHRPGRYYLKAGRAQSPEFIISDSVYRGAADFCLRYMRQQRCGFNPFLKDSCHTHDGYTVYGPMPEGTYVNTVGGWHDASDYLQYVTTSANATYHLLMAYRDFPQAFTDRKLANGLDGKNGIPDVLDEAKWGLDWLLKMHPQDDWMFDQIADDRDHLGMRLPKEDSFYGRGYKRPVYFVTGEPQGLFQYKNRTTGTSSTAAKFSSAFALGYETFVKRDPAYAGLLLHRSHTALQYALKKPGACQTAPCKAPYFYEEDNWTDDMELAEAALFHAEKTHGSAQSHASSTDRATLEKGMNYARQEKVTPWLGADTARHYQWYPFINLGHFELAKQVSHPEKATLTGYYREGIERVWNKARHNAFYRGVPFIWCSNNLTTSFAIQCMWYRRLSQNKEFEELEQANFDWLFGCNPWGTSFVYGLPAEGDTPTDPHSAFTHLKNYPIDGGLVDGPVYASIFNRLKGIMLSKEDAYAPFQSNLAVYHDDFGDYSTNEPTMDGTAVLVYLLAAREEK